jgi:DNA-binding transcriptional ArsR family regulator
MNMSGMGKLLASSSRVEMLSALMGGQALPASELAYRARITNQTASGHLTLLEQAGLVKQRACGRHRYYELAAPGIAEMLEGFSTAFQLPLNIKNERVPDSLKKCRFCYDHLAGEVGVRITDTLVERGVLVPIEHDYHVPSEQPALFSGIGITLSDVRRKKRHFSRQCIDWSERKSHVAGALGAALANRFLELGWISRTRDDRSAHITDNGKQSFKDWILMECD